VRGVVSLTHPCLQETDHICNHAPELCWATQIAKRLRAANAARDAPELYWPAQGATRLRTANAARDAPKSMDPASAGYQNVRVGAVDDRLVDLADLQCALSTRAIVGLERATLSSSHDHH